MSPKPHSRDRRPNGFAALFSGLKSALQWRLLLWWLLALGLPTLLFALPLWSGLQAQFGHSVHAADIATGRNVPMLVEGFAGLGDDGGGKAVSFGMLSAIALALLLTPWLTGMAVAAIRAGRTLRMGELAHGGLAEYWRMLRLLLWSLIPLGVAFAVAAGLLALVDKRAETAILASEVEHSRYLAIAVAAVLFVVAHSTIEAARGWLGAEVSLRSIFRAWWRGTKLVFKRPLATLVVYLGSSLVGYALAALFGYLRIGADGAGLGAFLLGFVLTQATVVALAWGRIARLYGFAALAQGRIAAKAAAAATDAEVTHEQAADSPAE